MDIRVPDIGDFDSVPVIEVLVSKGDQVAKEDPLIVLESDKATMEVPAPCAGTITAISIAIGDKVGTGAIIGQMDAAEDESEASADNKADAGKESPSSTDDDADSADDTKASKDESSTTSDSPAPADKTDAATADAEKQGSPSEPAAKGQGAPLNRDVSPEDIPHASPSIRRFAREIGVDLRQVDGSGRKGRITREDVQSYAKRRLQQPESATAGGALPAIPAVDFAKFGPVETVPLPRIRKLSAAHLHRSWVNVPHVTQTDRADITDLEAFRKARNAAGDGPKLTLLPFIIKACAHVLRRYPDFRSALAPDGEALIRRESIHIGFAADTENGLVVPVVRDADQKSVSALAEICAELADKARRGKLSPGDMQGGCFSISSLGGIGGEHFTPIVNAPEVAILGVSRASMAPVWDGQSFMPRLLVPLSLSYDHRVIDGAAAARFTTELAGLLADMRLMLL